MYYYTSSYITLGGEGDDTIHSQSNKEDLPDTSDRGTKDMIVNMMILVSSACGAYIVGKKYKKIK